MFFIFIFLHPIPTCCSGLDWWSRPLPQDPTYHEKTKLVLVCAVPGATGPVCCQRALLISKSDCLEVWAGWPAAELSVLSSMAVVRRRRRVPEGLTILFNNAAREEENEEEKRWILYATTSAVILQLFTRWIHLAAALKAAFMDICVGKCWCTQYLISTRPAGIIKLIESSKSWINQGIWQ